MSRRDPAKQREQIRAWAKDHPDKVREAQRKYRQTNLAKLRERDQAWRAANREKRRQSSMAWRKEHPEKAEEVYRKWRESHPKKQASEKDRQQRKAWRLAHPEQVSAFRHNRRALLRSSSGRYDAEDIKHLAKVQKNKCAACAIKMTKEGRRKQSVDHVIAMKNGGSNGPENLQLLCLKCNLEKQAMHDLEWARKLGRLFV
jgi:hypothetical protein